MKLKFPGPKYHNICSDPYYRFVERPRRVIDTKLRTSKQDKEFWNLNPKPGPCPSSSKQDLNPFTKKAKKKHKRKKNRHGNSGK